MSDARTNKLVQSYGPKLEEFLQVEDMELYYYLLPLLAEGQPVAFERVAQAAGRPHEEVAEAIRSLPSIEYDDESRIVGAGLTLNPTRHRFRLGGRTLYTWCAWDALIYPPILGRAAEVESTCPATGETIRMRVTPEEVEDPEPRGTVLSFPKQEIERACHNIRAAFCDRSNFFHSAEAAREWLEGREAGVDILTVNEGFELGRVLAAASRTEERRSAGGEGVACNLPEEEQERRREDIACDLYSAVNETRELEDGFAFRFSSDEDRIRSLSEFMISERECCPFYRYELVLEADGGDAWLHLRGDADVKCYLEDELAAFDSE